MAILKFFGGQKNELDTLVAKTFACPPALSTERLLLCKISPDHASDMYEYSCDPEVTKYLTWSAHSSVKETERYINLLQKKYAEGVFNDWGLIYKENGKFIGTGGYTSFDKQKNLGEVGYVLAKDFWGMGLAAEAIKTVMDFGFKNFGLDGYFAKHMEGNDASGRVMQKCGMTFEGMYKRSMFIKGEFKNIVVYNISKDAFYNKLPELKTL